jgi:type I restriction-modification system DNA methylase subunit
MLEKSSKSLESWIWDAACSIRGAKDAPKFKDFILPLIFSKRLCDVFDDEIDRIAKEVGSRAKAFRLVKHDKKLVRFYLPLQPNNPDDRVWSVIRTLSDKIGEQLTTHLRAIADATRASQGRSTRRAAQAGAGSAWFGWSRLFRAVQAQRRDREKRRRRWQEGPRGIRGISELASEPE